MLARLIVCATLALAAVPTAAFADDVEPPPIPVPAADALMTTAHALGVARWGTDPCGGQVAMTWDHMGDGINARSQWMSIDVHDPSTYSDCSITYNLDVDWDWPKLCTVVEHEMGHLSGHDHVEDPHDVMSPYYVYPAPECALPKTQAPAPDRAPRSVASSKRASSTKKATKKSAKRKTKKRASAARSKGAKKRVSKARKARVALASDASLAAPSLPTPPALVLFGSALR